MDNEINPDALGFTLTVDDAADALRLPSAEVIDLIRLGRLAALVTAPRPMAPLTFRLHPASVRGFVMRRDADLLTSDETMRPAVLRALREYLAGHPPTGDYERALREDRPLWGATRGGGRALHLRVKSVVAAHERSGSPTLLTISAVSGALEQVGGVHVRGVTPADGGGQRWAWWWRVPSSLLPAEGEDGAVVDVLRGVMEPGERLTTRGAARPYLAGELEPAP